MNKNTFFKILFGTILSIPNLSAQSEGLTSSPYSLYGLGIINQTSIGRSNSMGYTGIGLKTETEINNLNPSNFALIPQNSFFYDVGVMGEHNNFSNKGANATRTTLNFSNLAFAFRIIDGLGAGITMVPYSDVGYSLVGIQTNIEGANEIFESNVSGLGGLNDLRLNLGYSVMNKLRLGVSASFLFGNIEEDEAFVVSNSAFQLTETTNYSGVRLGLGLQYDISEKITFGSTIQFPTSLTGNLKRSVTKILDGSEITVEDEEPDTTSDFKMPMELGFGISTKLLKTVTLAADYKKNFWDNTEQTENIGSYTDQDVYAFGLEYMKDATSFRYKDRIRYRAGFNYDNGYLAINDSKIDGYNVTAGIGLPIGQGNNSMLNFSYSYGSKGQIQNILIQEDYHLLTLNLSLEDLWFRKRKIN
ncbi:MAG: hypothetical protein ABJN84_12665 [Flavobacteriaceae bacterium]